jgi:hypothetical protein
MPGLIDWLFGSGPLKKAAQFGTDTPQQTQPAAPGMSLADIAAAAQQQAARRPVPAPAALPLAKPAAPVAPIGKLQKAATRVGGQ